MSLETAIGRFRQRELDLMRSECTVTRANGEPVFDPATGTVTQPTTTVYSGACNIRRPVMSEREVGGAERTVARSVAKFPPDTPVERGDRVTVTASAYDAGLIDRAFTIVDVTWDDWQIARRVTVEEAQ
jgi:hypothetical protein